MAANTETISNLLSATTGLHETVNSLIPAWDQKVAAAGASFDALVAKLEASIFVWKQIFVDGVAGDDASPDENDAQVKSLHVALSRALPIGVTLITLKNQQVHELTATTQVCGGMDLWEIRGLERGVIIIRGETNTSDGSPVAESPILRLSADIISGNDICLGMFDGALKIEANGGAIRTAAPYSGGGNSPRGSVACQIMHSNLEMKAARTFISFSGPDVYLRFATVMQEAPGAFLLSCSGWAPRLNVSSSSFGGTQSPTAWSDLIEGFSSSNVLANVPL